MTTAETISGPVEMRNERGIRVQGEWRNLSKFRPLPLPETGATVRLGLDQKGFINTLEVLDGPDHGSAVPYSTPSRDRQIARLSVLKSAAAFAAARDDIKSSDVLLIADRWLAWVEAD